MSTRRAVMSEAVRTWIVKLDDNPTWIEWKRKHAAHTLYFGESSETSDNLGDFVFPPMVEKQHAIVFGYLGLEQTVWSLKKCEYYFPRSWRSRARPWRRYKATLCQSDASASNDIGLEAASV